MNDLDPTQVDPVARAAAQGLRHHVDQHLDIERGLATLPTAPPAKHTRGRVLAIAAALLLMVGLAATLSQQDGTGQRLDVDEDGNPLPDPEPGVLTPLGPDDGKDSIRLPVTIEPDRDLRDGSTVVASGTGFLPGEQVGIVQCAAEAGGESPETTGGADACDLSDVVYADADASGVATGSITLRRELTTPLTGTIDCGEDAERCLVGIGAVANFDRSGGVAFTVAGGEPIAIPELSVSPSSDLTEGSVVRVAGSGLPPRELVDVSVCSTDPATCWSMVTPPLFGLEVGGDGTVDAEVVVYRFLPGSVPGTYVDCAVSPCSLRMSGARAPAPVPLAFTLDDARPEPPAIAVDPTEDLSPRDHVVVRGTGYEPGALASVSLCVNPADAIDVMGGACIGMEVEQGTLAVDEEGRFSIGSRLPDLSDLEGVTACAGSGCDGDEAPALDLSCDGVRSVCTIVVEAMVGDPEEPGIQTRFGAVPVVLHFR